MWLGDYTRSRQQEVEYGSCDGHQQTPPPHHPYPDSGEEAGDAQSTAQEKDDRRVVCRQKRGYKVQ